MVGVDKRVEGIPGQGEPGGRSVCSWTCMAWMARAEGTRGQRGLVQWELDVRRTCRPLWSPTPAGSPELWLHCVFLSSGWPCLRWTRPAPGRQVLLPSPWGFWLECWAPVRSGVKAAALISLYHRSSPPWPWAQLALAASRPSGLRMDPAVAGVGSQIGRASCRERVSSPV